MCVRFWKYNNNNNVTINWHCNTAAVYMKDVCNNNNSDMCIKEVHIPMGYYNNALLLYSYGESTLFIVHVCRRACKTIFGLLLLLLLFFFFFYRVKREPIRFSPIRRFFILYFFRRCQQYYYNTRFLSNNSQYVPVEIVLYWSTKPNKKCFAGWWRGRLVCNRSRVRIYITTHYYYKFYFLSSSFRYYRVY